MTTEFYDEPGKKGIKKAMREINGFFDGCKGVSTPNDETYFIALDNDFHNKMAVICRLSNRLRKFDQDFQLGLKYDRPSTRWNIAVDFPPYSDDLMGVVK